MVTGSSPHTRGTPTRTGLFLSRSGIIPAYAGNTVPSWPFPVGHRDHPRIRGEHMLAACALRVASGSSPHTRGTPHQRRPDLPLRGSSPHTRGTLDRQSHGGPRDGIIPAYAGNTYLTLLALVAVPGSSPHTRGTRTRHRRHIPQTGIIPAYAGNTMTHRLTDKLQRDHPRIRGEHQALTRGAAEKAGSSPHTRGTLEAAAVEDFQSGIIPAYAGNTGF